MIHNGVWAVLAFAGVYTAVFMWKAGEPGRLDWWPFALGFFAWASVPYILVAFIATRFHDSVAASGVALATAGIMAAGGLILYWQAFVTNLDPQSGIVFVVAPFYQLVAAALAFLVAFAVHGASAGATKGSG